MKLARVLIPLVTGFALARSLSAQTVTALHSFTNGFASIPLGRLVVGGARLYGTASHGGSNDAGVVYALNTDGTGFTLLHDFSSDTNGGAPQGGLLLLNDTLFGTTALGGTNGPWGTVFSLKTNGTAFNVLHSFDGDPAIGQHPHPRLMLSGNTLFGAASGQAAPGWGSLFSINTDGTGFDSFYTFTTPQFSASIYTNMDGEQPQGALIPSGGLLYGTAYGGGTSGYGTVFSIQPDGNGFSVLHAFTNNPDGAYVRGGVLLADGVLYGTTWMGGTNGQGTIYSLHADGSAYQVLHSFQTNGIDGTTPWAGLVLWHHTLFGVTERGGGANGKGTIFSINTNGSAYTVFHTFVQPSGTFTNVDGTEPTGDLMISGNTIYGTTEQGGAYGFGTVFSLVLPRPAISGFSRSGANILLNATNGVPGESYSLLASPDIHWPLSQWPALATNQADASGNIDFNAPDSQGAAATQRFFILQLQ